jgi:hypothetical protein
MTEWNAVDYARQSNLQQAMAEDEKETFISDVLDAYRSVAAESPQEANTFKFYQMAGMLAPEASQ